jgi:hypothetical protein
MSSKQPSMALLWRNGEEGKGDVTTIKPARLGAELAALAPAGWLVWKVRSDKVSNAPVDATVFKPFIGRHSGGPPIGFFSAATLTGLSPARVGSPATRRIAS